MLLLDSQHCLIEYAEMFHSTIDSASVYSRELVKVVSRFHAATVIQAYGHPIRNSKPDSENIVLDQRIKVVPGSWRSHSNGLILCGWGRNCVGFRTRLAANWLRLLFTSTKLLLRRVVLHFFKGTRILYGFVFFRN